MLSASLAAAGDRPADFAAQVKARERKSWFGFGAAATIQIWGKPRARHHRRRSCASPICRWRSNSEAAFGLLGAAARAAVPYLQRRWPKKAVIDLKPFAADAKAKITAALADFQKDLAPA